MPKTACARKPGYFCSVYMIGIAQRTRDGRKLRRCETHIINSSKHGGRDWTGMEAEVKQGSGGENKGVASVSFIFFGKDGLQY